MPQWAQNLVVVAKFGGTNLESSYALSWLLAVKHPRAALLVFHTFRNQSVVSKTQMAFCCQREKWTKLPVNLGETRA